MILRGRIVDHMGRPGGGEKEGSHVALMRVFDMAPEVEAPGIEPGSNDVDQ